MYSAFDNCKFLLSIEINYYILSNLFHEKEQPLLTTEPFSLDFLSWLCLVGCGNDERRRSGEVENIY